MKSETSFRVFFLKQHRKNSLKNIFSHQKVYFWIAVFDHRAIVLPKMHIVQCAYSCGRTSQCQSHANKPMNETKRRPSCITWCVWCFSQNAFISGFFLCGEVEINRSRWLWAEPMNNIIGGCFGPQWVHFWDSPNMELANRSKLSTITRQSKVWSFPIRHN